MGFIASPLPRLLLRGAASLAGRLLRLALDGLADALGLGLLASRLVAGVGLRLAGDLVRLPLQPLRPICHLTPPGSLVRQRPRPFPSCASQLPSGGVQSWAMRHSLLSTAA